MFDYIYSIDGKKLKDLIKIDDENTYDIKYVIGSTIMEITNITIRHFIILQLLLTCFLKTNGNYLCVSF